MAIDWMLAATAAGPVVGAAAGVGLARAAEHRAKLITYYGHVSAFEVSGPNGPITINTHEMVIRNNGNKPAHNLRLGHHFLPKDFRIHPSVEHRIVEVGGNAREIVLPVLSPREQVTVSYLYSPPVYWNNINSYVKSDEGMAEVVQVLLQRQYPKWFQLFAVAFFLLGLVTGVYLAALGLLRLAP